LVLTLPTPAPTATTLACAAPDVPLPARLSAGQSAPVNSAGPTTFVAITAPMSAPASRPTLFSPLPDGCIIQQQQLITEDGSSAWVAPLYGDACVGGWQQQEEEWSDA
jgi:hypothetical protein